MRRAVLFDLYHTLVRGGTESERRSVAEAMGRDLGVERPADFAELFQETRPDRFRGELGDLESTLRTLARRFGVQPGDSAVRLACTRSLRQTRDLLWPVPGTLEVLDALRADGVLLGLVTNCSAETPALWKATPLAERFAATAFSCELGITKPDAGIYQAVCGFLAVRPEECVFVGDGAGGELAGARALGMSVIQMTGLVPPDEASPPWPGRRIETLAELLS